MFAFDTQQLFLLSILGKYPFEEVILQQKCHLGNWKASALERLLVLGCPSYEGKFVKKLKGF